MVANPLADKADPSYQAAVLQLETATKMHNLYAQAVGKNAGIESSAVNAPAAKSKVVMPNYDVATPTPGLMNTPAMTAPSNQGYTPITPVP